MSNFFKIMYDELKRFLADEGVMLIMVAAIVAYSFCYAMPYYGEIIQNVPIGIVDFDQTNSSKTFIRNLHSSATIEIKSNNFSMDEAEKEFYQNNIKAFVIIPQDFEKDILKGKQTNISFYGDSAYLIVYKTIYAEVLQTAMSMGGKIEVAKMMKQGISKNQALTIKQPFEFVQIPLFNSIGGYKSYIYPMIVLMILHQTLVFGLGMLQGTRTERKEKYCKNPKDIPITLFARSTFYVLLYTFYGAIAFLILPSVLTYPAHYNIIPAFTIYILMLYSAAFFAQAMAYCFRMRETVLLMMIPASLILIFIPGLIWPREAIPDIVNYISFFIPATCGIDGIIKINQNGASFMNVIYDFWWLLFLCVFYFFIAIFSTKNADNRL